MPTVMPAPTSLCKSLRLYALTCAQRRGRKRRRGGDAVMTGESGDMPNSLRLFAAFSGCYRTRIPGWAPGHACKM